MITGKRAWISLAALVALGVAGAEDLERGFANPPREARPHTWYHMMNGNVTDAGITRDFEELAKAGVGGVQMFDAGCAIPPGGLDFNSPEWFDMFRHAASEARRLGVEICIPNCSGWSSSGGPWNPPSNGMKRVVFTATDVKGLTKFSGKLPREMNDNGYYADIATLAIPVPPVERNGAKLPAAKLVTPLTAKADAAARLADGRKEAVLMMPRERKEAHAFTLEYAAPVTARAIELQLTGGDGWSESCGLVLEASADGKEFTRVFDRKVILSQSGTHSTEIRSLPFDAPVTFRALRAKFAFRARGRGKTFFLGEFAPVNRRRISGLEAKTFAIRQPVVEDAVPALPDQMVPREGVVDLTSALKPDGSLSWDAPAGDWRILRIGAICNGRCNHPASDHGKGLEVDKLSAAAMDYHFEQYVTRLVRHLGPLAGAVETGFNNILVDSYEVGSQNWTQSMPEEFRRRRGYDIRPYLPVFAGYVVGSVKESELFLEDFRRTVADLFAENYAGALTRKCHQYGLKCSIEPYGNCPADNLQYGQYCDIPMGEFWSHAGDPYRAGCGNAKFVSYVTHVWGKRYCGTESFTASPSATSGRWMTTPFSIKAQGDSAFANGVNRIIYHRYTHQPWADDKYLPGMTMGRWGMHLDRTQTWWEFSKPWFRYQARCQYMLQQGTFRADVLFFAGEEAPNQGGNTDGGAENAAFYKLPAGFDHDICPTDAMYALKVENGMVKVPGGVKYRVLAMPPVTACSPEMMECVLKLMEAGATVAWTKKPVRAPGLKWGEAGNAKVRELADRIWAKGVMGCTPAEALVKLAVTPDFTVEANSSKDAKTVEYIHRGNAEAEWYFVAMPNQCPATAELSFRQTGRVPELWDAETGVCRAADVWREEGGRTYVTVPFTVCGSKFVVFRKPAEKAHAVKCEINCTPRKDPLPVDTAKHTLVIRKAMYGVPATAGRLNCADVSANVRPGVPLKVTNSNLGGDPASMRVKELEVRYELGGAVKCDLTKEHGTYTLPKGAKLISAWYGVIDPNWKPDPGHLIDVTAKVASLVKDGTISVKVNNSLAGRDPIFGTVKRLMVTCIYDGDEKRLEIGENESFTLPKGVEPALPPPDAEWLNGTLHAWQPLMAKLADANGTVRELKADPPPALPITGDWEVRFPNGFKPNRLAKGAEEKVRFPELRSWSERPEKGIKYFSGIATYVKTVSGAETAALKVTPGGRVMLDLGEVKHFAEVTVNGKTHPVLWKPPFAVDVTDSVKPGEPVEISVRVANLWANRLIGDDREYAEDCVWKGVVKDGVKEIGVAEIPDWVKEGKASPTCRSTFTTWKHWDKNDELLPSGLLGPVYLRASVPCEK